MPKDLGFVSQRKQDQSSFLWSRTEANLPKNLEAKLRATALGHFNPYEIREEVSRPKLINLLQDMYMWTKYEDKIMQSW